jgi:hypothetical protein
MAAIEAKSQFERNDTAVSPRLAFRRSRDRDAAENGTAISMSAAIAMMDKMIVTLVKNSRVVIDALHLGS